MQEEWFARVHARLLAGDPTAPAELIESVGDALAERLARKAPRFANSELITDAVTDSLFSYIRRPEQFDPAKGELLPFLLMAADRDLRNALAKQRRRRGKEILSDDVELEAIAGKKGIGSSDPALAIDVERI